MADALRYSEHGVHQCWTCSHRVGQARYCFAITDNDSIDRPIVFILPECKISDRYMTFTYHIPCDCYECMYGKRREDGDTDG